jgi:hypothetical protein
MKLPRYGPDRQSRWIDLGSLSGNEMPRCTQMAYGNCCNN